MISTSQSVSAQEIDDLFFYIALQGYLDDAAVAPPHWYRQYEIDCSKKLAGSYTSVGYPFIGHHDLFHSAVCIIIQIIYANGTVMASSVLQFSVMVKEI